MLLIFYLLVTIRWFNGLMWRDAMSEEIINIKKGYLKREFEYFHLKDDIGEEFQSHYHDFNKIIIFVSGDVTYHVEGKAYILKPWDILFIAKSDTHKPVITKGEVYERIILWIDAEFFEKNSSKKSKLNNCFEILNSRGYKLYRASYSVQEHIKSMVNQIEASYRNMEFGSDILVNTLMVQLLVYINRGIIKTDAVVPTEDVIQDKTITEIIRFINENLNEDLSITILSSRFYVNKYYLMHKFKELTGYTIHNYILQKRLIRSVKLIEMGRSINEVYLECGFGDYSNFMRNFKKRFGISPKQWYKRTTNIK
jgi:AraC-like DNA-binding protein